MLGAGVRAGVCVCECVCVKNTCTQEGLWCLCDN